MKKRVTICAAACGLLLLGAAAGSQDPPTFRDVLRGRVGQGFRDEGRDRYPRRREAVTIYLCEC